MTHTTTRTRIMTRVIGITQLSLLAVLKIRFMGPMLIWPNITIVANVVFQEVSVMTRVRYTVIIKRVTVQTKMWLSAT